MRTRLLKAERRQKIQRIRPITRLLTSSPMQLHWMLPRRHATMRSRRSKKQSLLLRRPEQSRLNYMRTFFLTKHASHGRRSSRHKSRKHLGRMSLVSPHTKTPTKSWSSFRECVKFHLQTVFRFDAGEVLKYYITNTLKKPNWVSIHQFFVRVEQLNSYLETLPCLFYSPKANPTTKEVLPLDDADLVRLIYCACVRPGGRPSTTCPRILLRSVPGCCYSC